MKSIDDDSIITKNDNHVEALVDDALVLMHVDDGKFFHLEATGRTIWSMLDAPIALSVLCQKLATEYNSSPDRIRESTVRFLEQLESRELVIVTIQV